MYGFNTVSLDQKGRLAIPAKYRTSFIQKNETQIVITKDPQYPSLKIYPGSQWIEISSKLESLQGLDPIVRNLQWTILGNASVTEFDPKGRMLVLIPSELRKYAELINEKQISLIGMGNKFEIWNVSNWEMRQTGGSLATEILDVVLQESIKTFLFGVKTFFGVKIFFVRRQKLFRRQKFFRRQNIFRRPKMFDAKHFLKPKKLFDAE